MTRECACGCGQQTPSRFVKSHATRVFHWRRAVPVLERFLFCVEKSEDGCWEWIGARNRSGYGTSSLLGESLAHRVAYRLFIGPIPEGMTLDHLCRVRACVNPEHLEPVTPLENMRRGGNARKTHCIRGHEFTPENTHRRKDGGRTCRICERAAGAAYYRRRKAAA